MQLKFHQLTGLIPEVLDVHTMNNAPVSTVMKILGYGKLLFCRDNLEHADFIERVSNLHRRMNDFFQAAHG